MKGNAIFMSNSSTFDKVRCVDFVYAGMRKKRGETMVGMRDVAKKAGVSLSTVSLVVNKTGYVSDDMRSRVETAMKELNYVPNELARNLYKNRTNLVGVIVPTIRHPFFSTLTAHLQHELAAHGLRTMLCSTADAENGEAEYVDMLRRRMMDGIIVCSHTTHPNDYWTSIDRPVVAFDRVLGDGIASIGSDHEQGGRLMAHMLINTGTRHVVMVGGPREQFFDLASKSGGDPDDFDLHKTTFPTIRYYLTLEQELKAAGVRYEYVEAGNVQDFQGYKGAVNDVLNRMQTDGIDAVVSSDIGAALCVREALRRNISIPHDLQVIAYDGTYLTDLAGIRMTAVAQDFEKIAQVAVGHIVRAIAQSGEGGAGAQQEDGRKPYEPSVLIPVTLKLGDTTR